MRLVKKGRWGAVLLLGCCLLAYSAEAGGPIIFNEQYVQGDCALSPEDGCAMPWLDNRAVYVVETGPLGVIPNATAKAKVDPAFQRWATVPTANLQVVNLETIQDTLPPGALDPFLKDITIDDFTIIECTVPAFGDPFPAARIFCTMYNACFAQGLRDCPSPVIFDEDGSILSMFFGLDAGVTGFSGVALYSAPDGSVDPFRIVQAFTVLNGTFFDDNSQNTPSDDPTGTLFLDALMTHEFGHFLGLGHSVLNGDTALVNPAVSQVGTAAAKPPAVPAVLAPVDALASVDIDVVETMYPILLTEPDGVSPLNTLEQDDQVTLSTLYPSTTPASTGTIAGHVFLRDGTNAQGVVVIARKIDTSNSDSVLKEAVSQLTGNTFAPRRCNGVIAVDTNGDGIPDTVILEGLFGACSSADAQGAQECKDQLEGKFLGGGGFFFGQCGFVSAGFSAPRPVGEPEENQFVLKGLTPGKYMVQAIPLLIGAFSSPMFSNFMPTTPNIISNDNVNIAFFPNPQVGEFYNGDKEAGNDSDNPFAYVPVEVTAGGRVDNVSIVLNSSSTVEALGSDPGFNFCGLGDVNRDGSVDQSDIFAVVQAQAAFEKDGSVNPRADINEDGSVTFLDVDNITDIVTLPNPFGGRSEFKRGLAPFQAICTAARDDGCRLQAPVEAIQSNVTPPQAICNIAKAIGCQVIGCPQ